MARSIRHHQPGLPAAQGRRGRGRTGTDLNPKPSSASRMQCPAFAVDLATDRTLLLTWRLIGARVCALVRQKTRRHETIRQHLSCNGPSLLRKGQQGYALYQEREASSCRQTPLPSAGSAATQGGSCAAQDGGGLAEDEVNPEACLRAGRRTWTSAICLSLLSAPWVPARQGGSTKCAPVACCSQPRTLARLL
jgi:hypothetical protein